MEGIKPIEKEREVKRHVDTIDFIVRAEYSYNGKRELPEIAVNTVNRICTEEGLDNSYCEGLKSIARQKSEEADK